MRVKTILYISLVLVIVTYSYNHYNSGRKIRLGDHVHAYSPEARVKVDLEQKDLISRGVALMSDGYYDKALEEYAKLERLATNSSAEPLLKAQAYWWKIFKLSGDLQKLHTMDLLQSDQSPFDSAFYQSIDKAISLAEAAVKKNKGSAESHFYLGSAYGLKSKMEGARSNMLASAGLAKKMKKSLETCLSLNREIYDAYLGLGLYNYYTDTLSGLLKPLRFLILLPGGNREKGIRYLNIAKDKGEYVTAEAKFYLAGIYVSPSERKYSEGLAMALDLHKQYPNNPIFHLLVAQIYRSSGDKAKAITTLEEIQRLVRQGHDNYDEIIAKRVYVD